jgi:hypothetical protein
MEEINGLTDYWICLLTSSSNLIQCESRIAVAEAWGQFGSQMEGEHLLLEAGNRGLVKRQLTEKAQCML